MLIASCVGAMILAAWFVLPTMGRVFGLKWLIPEVKIEIPPELEPVDPSATGTDPKFRKIDDAARKTDARDLTVRTLALLLAEFAHTEEERARAVFTWIAHHIAYDGNMMMQQRSEEVLMRRTAVCTGYSQLYRDLCKELGLECQVIQGDISPALGAELGQTMPGHAWNAVKIGDRWRLVDVTWAAGSFKDGTFILDFKDWYFLVPPEKFIFTHFPNLPDWQLISPEWSRERFEALPLTTSIFHKLGMELRSHHARAIQAPSSGKLIVELLVPDQVNLLTKAYGEGQELDHREIENGRPPDNTDIWRITMPRDPAIDELVIFANGTDINSTQYREAVRYQIRW